MKTNQTQLFFYPTLIIVSLIIGISFKNTLGHLNRVDVTGSAKRDFISDIIVWESTFRTKNIELKDWDRPNDPDEFVKNPMFNDCYATKPYEQPSM